MCVCVCVCVLCLCVCILCVLVCVLFMCVCVGVCGLSRFEARLAQWIAYQTSNLGVAGSSPASRTLLLLLPTKNQTHSTHSTHTIYKHREPNRSRRDANHIDHPTRPPADTRSLGSRRTHPTPPYPAVPQSIHPSAHPSSATADVALFSLFAFMFRVSGLVFDAIGLSACCR